MTFYRLQLKLRAITSRMDGDLAASLFWTAVVGIGLVIFAGWCGGEIRLWK